MPSPKAPALHVRAVRPGDVPAVAALIASAFLSEGAGLGMGKAAWTAFLADQFTATPPHHIGVALEAEGGSLLGAVVLRTAASDGGAGGGGWAAAARAGGLASAARLALRDAILPETVHPGEVLIEYLAVSPAARRRGVAGQLLAWAGGVARDRHLGLWVSASNGPARALYARAGFVETEWSEKAGALTRTACAVFLDGAAWVRMERAVGKKAPPLLLPAPSLSLPSSPRLASYRPAV